MSVRIMSAVFDSKTLNSTERLIMLALADHADDDGRCYPSIRRLCERTALSERALQTNIKALQKSGHLTVDQNAGQRGVNVYFVHPTPAPDAPPQEMHPRTTCTTPPQQMRHTPAPDAPEPSVTIKEPSEEPPLLPPDKKPDKQRLPPDWALNEKGWAYARSKQIPDEDIEDEARGFHAYWTDRRDAEARKSERGWDECWANRVRSIAPRYNKGRGMAGTSGNNRRGQSGGIAGAAARRWAGSEI